MTRSLASLWPIFGALLASACSDAPLLAGCRGDHECPSGWICTADTCEQTCTVAEDCWGEGQRCIDGICRYTNVSPSPSCALGQAFFVSPQGRDSWSGRWPEPVDPDDGPWRTVQHAADNLVAGETVCIRAGTYDSFTIGHSGSPDLPITFANFPGEVPVIDVGTEDNVSILHPDGTTNAVGWLIIDGLEISNAAERGIEGYNVHHLQIRNCEVYHSGQANIHLYGSHHVTIENNILRDNGPSSRSHGLSATANYYTVANNVFFGVGHVGVHVSAFNEDNSTAVLPEFGNAAHWVIANNVFAFGLDNAAISIWDAEGTTSRCEDFNIANNVFFHNGENDAWAPNGISVRRDGTGTVIESLSIHHNIYFGEGDFIANQAGAVLDENANTNADPRFTDTDANTYAGNDFHPQLDSTAIDGGDAVFYVDTPEPIDHDFEYNPRPINGLFDIGIYEVDP